MARAACLGDGCQHQLHIPVSIMKHKQTGLTIIELMLSLALSLFLILVAAQFFVANKMTYRTQQAQADIQERGRFATSWLAQQLRQAGYIGAVQVATTDFNSVFTQQNASGTALAMAAGQVLLGTSGTVQVRYRGADDTSLVNCQGQGVAANTTSTHMINTSGTSLMCDGTEVVPGVAQLRLAYGQDSVNPLDRIADQYVQNAPASAVYAVRLCLLVQSLENNVSPVSQTIAADCDGNAYTPPNRAIAKVFRSSVYLRNIP